MTLEERMSGNYTNNNIAKTVPKFRNQVSLIVKSLWSLIY